MKYFNKKRFYSTSLFLVLFFTSCDSLLETDLPSNIVPQEDVYSNIDFTRAAVTGMYAQNFFANGIYEYLLPYFLSSAVDETYHNSTSFEMWRYNTYSPASVDVESLWVSTYKSVALSNDLIEQLSTTTVLPQKEQQENIGEARYFRAYDYFVLVNLFGDVPWVKSTNVLETTMLPRESKEKIITEPEGIIDDLQRAETALENSENTNAFVTKAAASALLARVYLYHEEWGKAETKADEVIRTSGYELETDLNDVFLRTSKESIFRISSSDAGSSYVGRTYIGFIALSRNYFRVTDDLLNSFEEGDLRREKWIKDEGTYSHTHKYKRNTSSSAGAAEDLVLLRLAEQYLIRAEARAQQNKLTGNNGAIADLNIIRNRAGLNDLPQTLTKNEVLFAVENERRHELFLEEAHRWWDLIRTGRIDAVLGAFSDKLWEPYKALLPIPASEIDKNQNLTSNPGYGDI
jgi:hypothetical protein